jgi:hypothetical protein
VSLGYIPGPCLRNKNINKQINNNKKEKYRYEIIYSQRKMKLLQSRGWERETREDFGNTI